MVAVQMVVNQVGMVQKTDVTYIAIYHIVSSALLHQGERQCVAGVQKDITWQEIT